MLAACPRVANIAAVWFAIKLELPRGFAVTQRLKQVSADFIQVSDCSLQLTFTPKSAQRHATAD